VCALFGIIGDYEPEKAQEAFNTLLHRGPDDKGVVSDEQTYFAHARLSIIDLSSNAHQPMQKAGVTLLFNGEIYNFNALAEQLGVKSASDTEVLLEAYLHWGEDFVVHVKGMYAIAIYEKGVLRLFRDPFGKKPLFYTQQNGRFIFASELKALTALYPKVKPNPRALQTYLSYQAVLAPETFYEGFYQLPAGYSGRYECGVFHSQRFHSPLKGEVMQCTESEALSHIETTLYEAIECRLLSDAPLGAFLSGGIDSSLIAAITMQKRGALPTFSIGYEGYEKYDERPWARRVAEAIGSDHHEVQLSKELFLDSLDEVFYHLDTPLADPAAMPLYHLSRAVADQGIKTVLSGDGADELFFGYRKYAECMDVEAAKNLAYKNWLRSYFKSNFSMNKEWEWYKRVFEGSTLFRGTSEVFTDLQQNALLKQNVKDNTSEERLGAIIEEYTDAKREDPVDWYSFIDVRIQLGELFLPKLDRMSMAHGLEARSPFMDQALCELLYRIPPHMRFGKGEKKRLLKPIALKFLPEPIVNRPKKGFSYPFMEWLLEGGEMEVINRVQKQTGMFNQAYLDFMLKRVRQKGKFKFHLYTLYAYCRWFEKTFL